MLRARSLVAAASAGPASASTSASSTWPCSSSSTAHLHTSSRQHARHASNHYETLDVSRTASAKDIKAQFYKLSKKYHPDINPDDSSAHKKYQEVTEAYATIGNEGNRRAYDRTLSSSSSGSGMHYASAATYSYDPSDNANRRARATYAWSYARRDPRSRGSRSSSSPGSNGAGMHARAGAAAGASSAESADGMSTFERYAAAERRREQRVNAARAAAASSAQGSAAAAAAAAAGNAEEHNAQTASPLIRFIQVAGLFLATYWVGTRMAAGTAPSGKDRRIKTEQSEEWEVESAVVEVEPRGRS